jgi:hypothetical protein
MCQSYHFQQKLLCTQDRQCPFCLLWFITGLDTATNSYHSPYNAHFIVSSHCFWKLTILSQKHIYMTKMRHNSRKENLTIRKYLFTFFSTQAVAKDWWEEEEINMYLHYVKRGWKMKDSLSLSVVYVCGANKYLAVWELNWSLWILQSGTWAHNYLKRQKEC